MADLCFGFTSIMAAETPVILCQMINVAKTFLKARLAWLILTTLKMILM